MGHFQLFSSCVIFWVMLKNIPKVVLWWAVSKLMHTYSPYLRAMWMCSLKTCAIGIGMSKNLHAWRIKPFWAFLPGQNRVCFFFHSISYLKPYLFLKIHKVVFDQKELLEITWKSLYTGFLACQLQWWWSEVCVISSLWDKFCILLNNGNFAKISLTLSFFPHTLLLTPSFCPPQMKFDPYPKKMSLTFP